MNIDWTHKHIRSGIKGHWDAVMGPGPRTVHEEQLCWFGSGLLVLAFFVSALLYPVNWSWWQYLLAMGLVFELGVGVIALASNVSKRWHHREAVRGKLRAVLPYCALHIHPFVIAGFFADPAPWLWAMEIYVAMLLSVVILCKTPLYLQRSMAGFLFVLYVIVMSSLGQAPEMFEWFMPVYLFKLIVCRAVCEVPFRPEAVRT
ncbi:MAG: hypothetical protein NTW08_02240 [Gammaproteobacteria bacterium]|nr:hypothetical protein [Gammaproteobacteria bacterium]